MGVVRKDGQGRPLLHRIVQVFKSVTTRECFKFGYRVVWQRNYYERIIRTEKEYHQICQYIKNNPMKYKLEKGKKNNSLEIAKEILENGEAIEKMIKYTKLTREEIEQLKDKN